jgi:hypothetical protein
MTFTYDGTSVAKKNHGLLVIDGSALTGGGTAGAASTTTEGAAAVVGWTSGDISVSGGTLLAAGADVVLTFDGASVSGQNHGQTVIDGSGLTGGSLDSPAETTNTNGQSKRSAWAALVAMGFATTSDVPAQGADAVAFTPASYPGDNAYYPSQATIRALADEAAISDDNVLTRTVILAAANLD